MIHFTEYIPSFCSFNEPPIEKDFETLEDVLEYLESEYDYCPPGDVRVWSYGSTDAEGKQTILISSTIKKSWFVRGFVEGIDLSKHLPRFDEVYKGGN